MRTESISFHDRLNFLRIDTGDDDYSRLFADRLEDIFDDIIDEFYGHIQTVPALAEAIQSFQESVRKV